MDIKGIFPPISNILGSSDFILSYLYIFFKPIKSISQRLIFMTSTTGATREEGLEYCVICLSSISRREEVHELRCDHNFHKSCMKRWLKNQGRTCPLCRDNLFGCSDKSNYNLNFGGGETILLNPFESPVHDARDTWWLR
ncbi:hypothetical protein J5N97_017378 [Dioscorea zingiberensis]|uniref:RING-type domain-containing protein n=1 Tax=Dioscorea zingiberensis TaxID=325984 RepID=A0A9D5CN40_9LILI|nr:hypothetical protein J5N97_017378 [Dioscorea zingiberensis]